MQDAAGSARDCRIGEGAQVGKAKTTEVDEQTVLQHFTCGYSYAGFSFDIPTCTAHPQTSSLTLSSNPSSRSHA